MLVEQMVLNLFFLVPNSFYVPLKYAHFGYHFFDFRWGEGACLRRPSFAFPEGLVTAQCFSEFLASLSGFLDLFGDLSRQ